MNKVLVKLYVPKIEKQYDIWLPQNKKVHNVIALLVKAVNEINSNWYQVSTLPYLYDKTTGTAYNLNLSVKEANIKNGTEIILI